ncbi:hypothetical protein [Myxococcus sp. SDU36]|uniref:hypothetical protein n=1 Tax=Myxococcus sp. SDU36 TaxID=2831967 RepID=UPI002542D16D|nr:hypothetical protein [Myxococcus sp. SDU36]
MAKQALEALFRGELDRDGFTRLRAHAATCASCREAYDRLARVESSLEKRVLPERRQALLEDHLFARLRAGSVPAKSPTRAAAPERFTFRPWMGASLGFAVAAVLVMLVVPAMMRQQSQPEEWQARSGAAGSAYGVRAFCIGPAGQVVSEARPGGALACPEGSAVQFSYTAPQAARLRLEAASPSGEPLRFFPREGTAAEIAPGVDVPLPYSTPVQGGWLSGALEVRARFTDAQGRPLAETRVTLTPR